MQADPGGRAVKGICFRPLACWDCGFEFRHGGGHEYLYLVTVSRYQVEAYVMSRSLVQRGPTERARARVCVRVRVCVCVCH